MPNREVDAVLYVQQIPEITYETGHFHVRYDVGLRSRFEFVFSPATFIKMRARAAKVLDEFHKTKAKVELFEKPKGDDTH